MRNVTALEYAGKKALNHPLLSPLHADHALIAKVCHEK